MEEDLLLKLTGDIVAARVGNNNLFVNDVAALVQHCHAELAKLGALVPALAVVPLAI